MGEFNFEEQFYVFKIIEFLYVNSISSQRWCGIDVEEWCFILFLPNGDIEQNIKISKFNEHYCWIIFQTKNLHAFTLEGSKRNEMGTCDSDDERPKGKLCMKECHCLRDCILFKEWLEMK
jgi:hypothetical protein